MEQELNLASLRFDIEDNDAAQQGASQQAFVQQGGMGRGGRSLLPGSKDIVCMHYLVGMCALDKDCPFLHQYVQDKVPVCPYGSKCIRGKDCPYKHVAEEDKVECVFYRQGFCMYGPFCRYRHVHRAPEECPEEADLSLSAQREGEDDGGGMGLHRGLRDEGRELLLGPRGGGAGARGQAVLDRNKRPGGALERNENYKTTLCNHWLQNKGLCPFGEDCVFAHGEGEKRTHPLALAREQQQVHRRGPVGVGALAAPGTSAPPGPPIPAAHEIRYGSLGVPLQEGWRVRYFVMKSLNYKNLAMGVRRSMWRTHRNNERILNEAFRTYDKVVLFFSVNESGHWQGAAIMKSLVRNQPPPPPPLMLQHQQDGWTAEFSVEWLRLVSLPFPHTRPLRNPLNDNLPISRSRDCQELTPDLGRQLLYLIYTSPEQNLALLTGPHASSMDPGPYDPLYMGDAATGGGLSGSSSLLSGGGKDFPVWPGPGFVFGVTNTTLDECLGRGLVGGPASLDEDVRAAGRWGQGLRDVIVPGTIVFLYNNSNRTLLGIFEATSSPNFNIEPHAWSRTGTGPSPFPLQVRIRCLLEAPPLMVESDPEALAILGPTPTSPMGRVGPMEEHQVQRVANLLASRAGLHSLSQQSGLKPPLSSAPGPIMPPSPPPPPIMPLVRPSSLYASSGFHKGGAVPVSASPRGMAPPSLAGLGGFGGLGGLGPNPHHHGLGDHHPGTGSPNYPGSHSPPHQSNTRDRTQGLGGAGGSWRPL